MRDVTVIYPYYENPDFLTQQVRGWIDLAQGLRTMLTFCIVDDGSRVNPANVVLLQMLDDIRGRFGGFRLFRIDVDVRWNWLAARNVGAHHARDQWILLTDMDHVIDESAFLDVTSGALEREKIYRFSRREWDGSKIHPHPNSWLMTKEMFWRVGGYDEALSGHYGTDGEYRRRCARTAPIRIMDTELERHEHSGDSSTRAYARKQPEDAAAKQMIKARGRDWKPRTLSFPYHEVLL